MLVVGGGVFKLHRLCRVDLRECVFVVHLLGLSIGAARTASSLKHDMNQNSVLKICEWDSTCASGFVGGKLHLHLALLLSLLIEPLLKIVNVKPDFGMKINVTIPCGSR